MSTSITWQDCFLQPHHHRDLTAYLQQCPGDLEQKSAWFAANGCHIDYIFLDRSTPLFGLLVKVLSAFQATQLHASVHAGLEWWINRNTSHGWHLDKDELLFCQTSKVRPADRSFLYYVVQPNAGGELELMPEPLVPPSPRAAKTRCIDPVAGRLVSFDSRIYHRVRAYDGGRLSIAMNGWSAPPSMFSPRQGLLL